jgi:peptidoglycan/LPS O-acetylase OafA/YrhL
MSLPAGTTRSGRHLGALDGIRGLAAVAVVVTHVGFESGASFRGMLGAFAARGEIGVAIFFVLSGFLLYRPFAAAHASGGSTPAVGQYLWNRALRIFPAYVVVLAVVLLVHHRDELTLRLVGSNLLLLQTYSPGLLLPELAQSWTLSTEVSWYLFLPLLGVGLLRRPAARSVDRHVTVQLAACLLMVAVSIGYAVVIRGGDVLDPFLSGYWLPHYLGWFALGMAMAVLHVRREQTQRPQWLSDLAAAPLSCWALAFVLYAIVCTPVAGPRGLTGLTVWEGLAREGLYAGVAVLLILPAAFGDPMRSVALSALASRPARYLGEISYALYLWHFPLLPLAFIITGTAEFGGRFWLNLVVLLAIALPVAALSWHLVEKPALRAKAWRPWRRPQSSTSEPSVTPEATAAATATAISS